MGRKNQVQKYADTSLGGVPLRALLDPQAMASLGSSNLSVAPTGGGAGRSYEDFITRKRADDVNFQKEFPVGLPDTFKGGSSENSPKSKAARKEAEAIRDSLIAQGYKAAVKHTTSSYAAYGKGTVTNSSFKVFRSEIRERDGS